MIDFLTIVQKYMNANEFDFSSVMNANDFDFSSVEWSPCPDQYVGVISEIQQEGAFTCRLSASARPPGLACVLLVLDLNRL